MISKLKQWKDKHPIAAFLLISKVMVITLSIFGMWLTLTPSLSFLMKSIILIVVNIAILPLNYWLTYKFGDK